MAEPNDRIKTLLRDWQACKEAYENRYWPSVVNERYKHVEEGLVADFSASLAEGKQSMGPRSAY
jgi:hypothetical protein